MDQLKNVLVLVFLSIITSIGYTQNNTQYTNTKTIVWSKIENGFQIQLIRENNHEYILKTPLDLVEKINDQPQVDSYAGVAPYGASYKIPEIQTDELIQQRVQGLYAGLILQYNQSVKKEIDKFLKDRRLIEQSLGRAKFFMPISDSILAHKTHLPRALKYLPLVESNFEPKGRSRVGAQGLWQFMRGTGRLYGLSINYKVDERLHPTKATDAAIEHLDDLHQIYDDWYLALAAYNCGPGRVNKAINQSGKNNPTFWDIQHLLPSETRHYIPKFIAAVYVMEYADQIGLLPNWDEYEVVKQEVEKLYANNFSSNSSTNTEAPELEVPENATVLIYTVKSGDNLGFIADWYDVSAKQLRGWNKIKGNLIKPGQNLTVYVPTEKLRIYKDINRISESDSNNKRNQNIAQTTKVIAPISNTRNYIIYTIQNGDTLWDISRKNGVSLEEIKQLNNISNSKTLQPGMVIKIREKS